MQTRNMEKSENNHQFKIIFNYNIFDKYFSKIFPWYKAVYAATYENLAKVMIDPRRPNKNKGEVCSLAYAKATGIPVFATDEMNLQPIIDTQLNTGIDDITCIRIVDIIEKAHQGEIAVPRKVCKALWIICGKLKETFDREIWPLE